MKAEKHFTKTLAAFALMCGSMLPARAQIGSGWMRSTETYTVKKSPGATVVPVSSGGTFTVPSTGYAYFQFNYLSETTTEEFQGAVMANSFSGDHIAVYEFRRQLGAPVIALAIEKANGGTFYDAESGLILAPYPFGTTAQINTIYDPIAGEIYLYINGSLAEQKTVAGGPFFNICGAIVEAGGTGPATIIWKNIQFWTGGII
jgi:hypothetical protein